MNSKLIVIILLVCSCVTLFASPEKWFEEGNKYYKETKYAKAIESYSKLVDTGYTALALEYNIGNAYMENNQLGKAILHYERALVLKPNDKAVQYNLDIANHRKLDQFKVLTPFYLTTLWNNWRDKFTSNQWSYISFGAVIAVMISFLLWLFLKKRALKKVFFILAVIIFFVAIVPVSLALARASQEIRTDYGIILVEKAELKQGPDSKSETITNIHEGSKIQILDRIGQFYKVYLPNGEEGWVSFNTLELI